MSIALFNPSISSLNLGDEIITDSVLKQLHALMPSAHVVNLPTQEKISKISIRIANSAEIRFVGGTNLLSSKMLSYKQWQINLLTSFRLKPVTLLGVGWWQYQAKPDAYTQLVLRRVLDRNGFHSVRDEYTKRMLNSIGVDNVINTGCPTMWSLSPEHCATIDTRRSDSVLLTLTDYNQMPALDVQLIELLKRSYSRLLFWPQGWRDKSYFESLGVAGVEVLPSTLRAFDHALGAHIDYVGTRLHAGVRALQNKRRALIIAIDNRAAEMSKDTNLPVASREDMPAIESWIAVPKEIAIAMNFDLISKWKAQF